MTRDVTSGDVTRSRKRGEARSGFGAYKARGRGSGRDKEARYREGCDKEGRDRRDVTAAGEERYVTDVTSA